MRGMNFALSLYVLMLLLCGCQTVRTTAWQLPQGYDPIDPHYRITIQIEDPTVSRGHSVDPATVVKLKTFLFDQFNSSARFVVSYNAETAGNSNSTAKKGEELRIMPILGYHRKPLEQANLYYCQTSISCRFFDYDDRDSGCFSQNGADDISVSKNCPRPIIVRKIYGKEHFNVTEQDVDTMFNESFVLVWNELEKMIAEKFPANAKIKSVLSTGASTKLAIDEGVANGFHNDDLFKVYAVKDKIVTVVALASGQVGKSGSTLTITRWNMDDPVVRDIYYPQMQRNQADNLYVVAEQPKLGK